MPALSRRLVVGATSAALLAGVVGFVPLLGSASAACAPTYKDPADDAAYIEQVGTPDGNALLNSDADLDILDITHTVDAGAFTSIVHVTALGTSGPYFNFADRFTFNFTVGGKAAALRVTRDYTPLWQASAGAVDGVLLVGGTATTTPVTVVVDYKTNTVAASVKVPDMEKALGGPLDGKPFTAMTTTAMVLAASDLPVTPTYTADTATAAVANTYAFGASCSGGGGTPAPTGSGTPTATPSPSPTSSAPADGLYDQPRKGCVGFKDATGDADPTGLGPLNEGSLDITQVNLKSPSGALMVMVGLANPAEALFDVWSGRVYNVSFTVGGKAVTLSAPGEGPATAKVAGAANSDIKSTVKVDAKNKNIVFTVPLEGLAKATATAISAGTAITATSVLTQADSEMGAQEADTAAGVTAAEKTYAYGDNTCFLPPAGLLTIEADPSGQYGDSTDVYATLTDADEAPVQGATVTAVIAGGKAVSAVTDEDGVAGLTLPLKLVAATRPMTISFAGNAEVGAVKVVQAFKVVAEKTVLKAVGVRGGAKATVLDDDKHPVVGKPVTFLIGKTKKVVKTNAKGIAVLAGVAKGTAIKVSFPAVKGYYLGTPTYTVKAL